MAVAVAIVSASVAVLTLAGKLVPQITEQLTLLFKSREEAESLSAKLMKIHVGLQDAEQQGVTNDAMKNWLKEVQDVAYEMEDVLEEGKALQVKQEGDVSQAEPDMARSHVLFPRSCFKLTVYDDHKVTKKMKALSDRIDKLLSEKDKYNFVAGKNDHHQEFTQEASTSLVNKLEVYGRDAVKDSIVLKLTTSPEGEEPVNDDVRRSIQIVSIVGIGGVGKTTLAQLAYNDAEVNEFFDMKGWVSVSKLFDTSAVAKAICEQFGVSCADAQELETRVQRIKTAVMGKKFLLVLDNVWTEDVDKWSNLKNCLEEGAEGSRILVTTRNDNTANMMGTTQWERLNPLSDSECSQILNGIALNGKTMRLREKLEDIGVEIAKKCKGLPLAARAVGTMLNSKSRKEEWITILESPLWKNENVSNKVFPVLNLSYNDLSHSLKGCFLSSIVLPPDEGGLIIVDRMIRIWMACGYLNSEGDYSDLRSEGLQYFSDLETRSFFQKMEIPPPYTFIEEMISDEEIIAPYQMHDVLREFAESLLGSREYNLVVDVGALPDPSSWSSLRKLRSFSATNVSGGEFPLNILSHLKSVRVLSLCNCNLQSLPERVGELEYLRYLDLSNNPISELPQTVCNLSYLQTLGIENCENLSSLPKGFGKLRNLRHLVNKEAENLVRYPRGFERLEGLWTLSEFKGSKLECLGNMNQIRGIFWLYLMSLQQTGDIVEQARMGKLEDKKDLKELRITALSGCERIDGFVEALQPPPNLQILYIYESTGKWFSHWIQNSFNNLAHLVFSGDLNGPIDLPPFATLPALEKLAVNTCLFRRLRTMDFLGLGVGGGASSVDRRRRGGFPRLRKLTFLLCWDWEEWEDIEERGVLSCLEELEIIGCPKLEGLPHSLLRQATSLRILTVSSASQTLIDRYNESGHIEHITKVTISRN